jgi:hypothetical protein
MDGDKSFNRIVTDNTVPSDAIELGQKNLITPFVVVAKPCKLVYVNNSQCFIVLWQGW